MNIRFISLGLLLISMGVLLSAIWWQSIEVLVRGAIPLIVLTIAWIKLSSGFLQLPIVTTDSNSSAKLAIAAQISKQRLKYPQLSEFLFKEDWWAILLGMLFVSIGIANISNDTGLLQLMAVNPGAIKWHNISELGEHFSNQWEIYILQFAVWATLFSISCRVMGIAIKDFIKSFLILYFISIIIFSISGWENASSYNLEPPLVALIVGLIIANTVKLPNWTNASFRVEYYVKTGIVLLGATFPITLVISAGPVAIGQATFVSLIGCATIYFVGTRFFNLDKRLAAVLSVGGSVCGVSASMAIAAAVGAKKEHIYTSVTLVVGWALVMILFLPFISKQLDLPAGVAGAWIGTSEFADAAGFAAASAYGKMVGNEESAIKAFTLMKVIGRDLWIGIWALVWAFIATTIWTKNKQSNNPNNSESFENDSYKAKSTNSEIWQRFPKFVIGFFIASIIVTIVSETYSAQEFIDVVKPNLMEPINAIRGWVFIFCFLSIGLTTRFRELKSVNWQTFTPFTIGVMVNVIAGFILSVYVFGDYWAKL